MRLSFLILTLLIFLISLESSLGSKSSGIFKECKGLQGKAKKKCVKSIKKKIQGDDYKKFKKYVYTEKDYMTMLMMQQFKNTCDVCLVGESSCCNMTTKQKPDKTKFKLKCKNCQQPCLDCYEKSFLQEAPKKNKFKRKAFQPNDLSQMSEKTAEKVRETYEVFLKEGKLPKEEVFDVDPRKDRKMKKKKDKKNKKKTYKCFDKKCDVCRNSSCCSYKEER